MDSPNSTENMTTGTNESTGPDPDRPRTDVPQPQWKTAFSAPRPAPTDSRFMTEATSGISRLRNTTSSRTNARITTTAMNTGSLSVSTRAKSILAAVTPPTWTTRPVPRTACGIRSCRMWFTRSTVGPSCGPLAGYTVASRTCPFGEVTVWVTAVTPGVRATVPRRRPKAATPAGEPGRAASSSGPLNPGPNPSARVA